MKQKCVPIICVCLCFLSSLVFAKTVPQLAKTALTATVRLEMVDADGKAIVSGSGFFVAPNVVATNHRVIQGAVRGQAQPVSSHRKYAIEGVVAIDTANDLTLLKLSGYNQPNPLPLMTDSDTIKIGETVYVAGSPKAAEGTFTPGVLYKRNNNIFEMRTQMSPGSSGGAVVNPQGEVIGVALTHHTTLDAPAVNTVIPANALKKLFNGRSDTTPTYQITPLSQNNQPLSVETYFYRGYVNYQRGDYERAIHAYTMVIHLDTEQIETVSMAFNNRGMAKAKLHQDFAAIADYNTAIKLHSNNAEAYNNRGVVKMKMRKYLSAIMDFDSAIALKRHTAGTFVNRGRAKAAIAQYEQALTDYDTAIEQDSAYASAYSYRGIAKAALGDLDGAMTDYDTAINLMPDHATTYRKRGMLKVQLEKHSDAQRDYDTAIRLNPDDTHTYTQRGIVKAALGHYSQALTDFDTAIRLVANNPLAHYHRGVVKLVLRHKTDGEHDLRIALKYVEKGRNTQLKRQIEQTLTDLK